MCDQLGVSGTGRAEGEVHGLLPDRDARRDADEIAEGGGGFSADPANAGGRSFSNVQTLADPIVDIKIQNLESGIAKEDQELFCPRRRPASGRLLQAGALPGKLAGEPERAEAARLGAGAMRLVPPERAPALIQGYRLGRLHFPEFNDSINEKTKLQKIYKLG